MLAQLTNISLPSRISPAQYSSSPTIGISWTLSPPKNWNWKPERLP